MLEENGWVPNNQRLPVLFYRGAMEAEGDAAARFEKLFASNGWAPDWRDTIFDYHHYHSTAHEALGIAKGSGRLEIGGPGGREIAVTAGDALVLPVGTGHRRIEASEDFLVIGAYPEGQDWDMCCEAPSEEAGRRIREFPVPDQDPVEGGGGTLSESWR